MTATIRFTTLSDDQLEIASRENPGWQLERDGAGALLVSPTASQDGAHSAEALVQLALWARSRPGGKVFDSSTGFRLADRSVFSPDAAWIAPASLATLAVTSRRKFWPIAPDVVVEIRSSTDSWTGLQAKLHAYVANGTTYAIAIDPYARTSFELGTRPATLRFDIDAIADA